MRAKLNYSIAKKSNKGMTFIEVLVALFIMVTGILGAVAMQATAKKGSFDAMQRSLASSLAQDMIERMRSNDSAILESYEGVYGAKNLTAPTNRCDKSNSLCTSAQMVTNDLYEWEQAIKGANVQLAGKNVGGLANASGCITHTVNQVVIVVTWQGREKISDGAQKNSTLAKSCGTSGNKRRQVVIDGFIY